MDKTENSLTTFVPLAFKRRGVRQLAVTETPAFDTKFIECLGLAFYWQQLIDNGVMASGSEIARQEGLYFTKVSELDKYCKHLIYKESGVLKGYNNG